MKRSRAEQRGLPMCSQRLACLIAARNLGDTVVVSTYFRRLVRRGLAEKYLVWTRPQLEFLFRDMPACEVITSSFPVGTSKNFGGSAALRFLAAASAIRRRRPTMTIDFTGDIRERLFARLIGAAQHAHIAWTKDHPFTRLIRNPFGSGRPLIVVPASATSVYAAYDLFLDALAPGRDSEEPLPSPQRNRALQGSAMTVGIHPYASQACKLWPEENWRKVVAALLARGIRVVAFSAPAERSSLAKLLGELSGRVELMTGTLEEFFDAVRSVDILVGVDSVAVHIAHSQGVRAITINGGTPPGLWATPSGRMLADSGGCASYPCFNVAPCRGRPHENACVRSISPSAVLAAIQAINAEISPPHTACEGNS